MIRKFLIDQKGFTLVEVLVVMLIMGILIALAVPAFEPMEQSVGLKTTARELVTQLRYAQQKAITEGVHHSVYLYLDSKPTKIALWRQGNLIEEKTMARGIKAASTAATTGSIGREIKTTFTPTGNPVVGAGAKTIVLTNNQGYKNEVVISSVGRIRIEAD